MPGKWVIGALANNLWSFAGDSDRDNVNLMTVQPFVNYNIGSSCPPQRLGLCGQA